MKALLVVAISTLLWCVHPAIAKNSQVVACSGVLIEVDMVTHADFPMAVIYDNSTEPAHTCVLDLGHAGHWPLRGACWVGEKCVISGPYFKKIGDTYYMRRWDRAEAPGHAQ
jgi:hypothetical protein